VHYVHIHSPIMLGGHRSSVQPVQHSAFTPGSNINFLFTNKLAWGDAIILPCARTSCPDLERGAHEEITLALATRAGVLRFLTELK
jgi:hypothetical protein